MRSSSISISKRQLAEVTVQTSLAYFTAKPKRSKISVTVSVSIWWPNKLSNFSRRKVTSLTFGKYCSLTTSQISPASPPQISSNNAVARSIAWRCSIKSTPRSKRCEESVCKPYCLALAWPPKIPAIANGPVWSAITKVFGCNFAVVPSNKTSSSPLMAKRTWTGWATFDASKACIGWPNSSKT